MSGVQDRGHGAGLPGSPRAAARCIDHTLLKPTAGPEDMDILCDEAVRCGFAAVCVPPGYVRQCAGRLDAADAALAAPAGNGSGIASVAVATVIGFPLGNTTTAVKSFEARQAVAGGASELDVVMNLGLFKGRRFDAVVEDLQAVVAAAGGVPVKVIIETGFLDDEEKRRAVELLVRAGAQYVKTSTGFGPGGATVEDVRLLAAAAAGRLRVKASGGIRDAAAARAMLAAGAARLGTSSGVAIIEGWHGG